MAEPEPDGRICELLARVFDASSDWHVLFRVDANHDLVTIAVNQSYRRFAQSVFGARWVEPVGLERQDFLRQVGLPDPEISLESERYSQALCTGEVFECETELMLEAPLIIEARIEPLLGPDGAVSHVLWTARDISARRAAEEERADNARRLQASLEEKDTLLREVHHRVKNNLQIVDSLLYFQMQKATSEDGATSLSEARARLWTMSLVHEQLYSSEGLSRVALGEYTRELLRRLASSHMADERLEIEVGEGDMQVPIDTALSCGMILNELVANAFRHAYPGPQAAGIVRVSLRVLRAGVQLRVSDEGVGTREHEVHAEGFGLRLVRRLLARSAGTLSYESDESGTRVTVELSRV